MDTTTHCLGQMRNLPKLPDQITDSIDWEVGDQEHDS